MRVKSKSHHTQTDRHTDRQSDRQTDRHTDSIFKEDLYLNKTQKKFCVKILKTLAATVVAVYTHLLGDTAH